MTHLVHRFRVWVSTSYAQSEPEVSTRSVSKELTELAVAVLAARRRLGVEEALACRRADLAPSHLWLKARAPEHAPLRLR